MYHRKTNCIISYTTVFVNIQYLFKYKIIYNYVNTSEHVLNEFYKDPQQTIHIRELARRTNKHPNTIISVTDELQEQEILVKQRDEDSNRVLISANKKRPYFAQKCTAYYLEQLYRCGLITYLQEQYFHPTILLFGSIAKAQHTETSDIDLFVLSDVDKHVDLSKYEQVLSREIQLVIQTHATYQEFTKSNPELANNVLNGLLLEGYMQVYE